MPNWNWNFPHWFSSSPNHVGPFDGNGSHPTTRVFGADGLVDPKIIGTLARFGGGVEEACFGEDLTGIVDFVDQVLEVCTPCAYCERMRSSLTYTSC